MLAVFGFLIALFAGVPIFTALLLAALLFMFESGNGVLVSEVVIQFDGVLGQSGLLAVPLFMLAGELMNRGGLTQRLIACAGLFVGGLRGGLAYVNLLANAMAASILGSATAQIAVMSRLMIPEMEKKGYDKNFAAAVTVSGGLLGPVIPPSMLMIIYGVIAYQPVSALFLAGIVPGVLIVAAFALVIAVIGWTHGLPSGSRAVRQRVRADLLAGMIPGCIPVAVILLIATGVMTPTEAGAVAAVLAFAIGTVLYRRLKWRDLPGIFARVCTGTAAITGLIAAASLFGWTLTFEGIPDQIVAFFVSLTDSKTIFLLTVYLLVVVLGMFLESISVMIVMVPLLLPAVRSFGIDPVHFGVVVSLATLVGLVTPPVGPGLFIAMQSANLKMMPLFRAMIPFLAAMLFCMLLIALVPALSLWLPGVWLK
ncbi:TRAP transporter large permease [Neisseria leonii]|uniref:TRAP transporter large permease n=1 Tax=Neisseria leonii TaxID=2995413 RepID=UPI00237A4F46|nr:TRAP transporter large permease [Neisseria sp. 3986]MDD9326111.1 TRAP transporter large permease [Neisseria sp. 3986]